MDTIVSDPSGPALVPNYSFTFRFEQGFDYNVKREWMVHNWHTAFYWVSIHVF